MGMSETASTPMPGWAPGGTRLGERVRALRVAAGLTQVELADGRFSKEYISQIERGKTRPTESTIALLAERLGVDQGFLVSGVSSEERTKVETLLARAEALSEAHQYSEAIDAFREARPALDGTLGAEPRAPDPLRRGVGAPAERGDQSRARAPPAGTRARGERRSSRMSTAPTCCSASGSAATSSRASAPPSRSSTKRWLWPSAPVCRVTCCAPTSSVGVRAAIGSSATTSPRTRTSSAHSSSHRIWATDGRSQTRTSRRP